MGPFPSRRGAACLAMLLLAATAAPRAASAAPSPCSVSFSAPAEDAILYGPVALRAAVSCPGGEHGATEPGEVAFLVDGREIGRSARPPYGVSFDAGGSFAPRLLEARWTDGAGREARALRLTRGAALTEAIRVDGAASDRVTLSVTVADAEGRFVRGLARGDFAVFEGGRERPVEAVREEGRPLSAAILIDASGSTAALWPALRRAAPAFARSLGPDDVAKVVAFSGPACLVQDFTRDPGAIEAAMARFRRWGGGTSLYDTLAAVGVELSWRRGGRQAVIVLTDGVDTLSRIDPRRLRDYLRRSEVVFEVLLLRPPGGSAGPEAAGSRAALEDLARDSGGALRPVADPDRLEETFREVGDDLRDRYAITYVTGSDGDWRRVQVRARRSGITVRGRAGIERERDASACLVDDLERGDVSARSKAAEWIGNLAAPGPGSAADALLRAVGDRSAEVRAAAAGGLGRVRDPRAIAPLTALLEENDEGVRRAAAQALTGFGGEAVPALLEVLERGGEEARVKAISVLASSRDPRAIEAILRLARPPAPRTAEAAGRGGRESRPDPRLRAWAIWALGRIGRPADVPLLLAASAERDPRVREAALRALGESGDPRSVPRLLDSAGPAGPDAAAREAALSGLFAALQILAASGRLETWALREGGADPFLEVVARALAAPGATGSDLLAALGGPARVASILETLAAGPPERSARARDLLARLRAPQSPA
jgi:VWFA-related protein